MFSIGQSKYDWDQLCLSLIVVPHLNSSVVDKMRERKKEKDVIRRKREREAILGIFRSNACITYTQKQTNIPRLFIKMLLSMLTIK